MWLFPFLWILLIPMVTMPLQVERLGASEGFLAANVHDECELVAGDGWDYSLSLSTRNNWECPLENVLPTLLPGALNVVPFLWLLSRQRKVRYAALVAGSLGLVRVVVPALIYVAAGTVTLRTTYWPGPDAAVVASLTLWVLSLAAVFAIPMRFRH